MLNGKQKRYLRALAVQEKALFQVGKEGLSHNLYSGLKEYLKVHELVKVTILKNADLDLKTAAYDLAAKTGSEIVQIIGHTLVLYQKGKDNKLELPQ